MNRRARSAVAVLASIAALALLLTACSLSGSGPAPTPTATPPPRHGGFVKGCKDAARLPPRAPSARAAIKACATLNGAAPGAVVPRGFVRHYRTHTGVTVTVRQHNVSGGFVPPKFTSTSVPMTPPHSAPAAGYGTLQKFMVRIHNQGDSNSCVGQSLSTLYEVESTDAGHYAQISGGFAWAVYTQGSGAGSDYEGVANVWAQYGQSPLYADQADGTYPYYPSQYAFNAASGTGRPNYRTYLNPYDSGAISWDIDHGFPVAFAIPVYDSFYNNFGGSYATDYGPDFFFWHSMVIVGYNATQYLIVNSWGPGWGAGGYAWIDKSLIGGVGGYVYSAHLSGGGFHSYHPRPAARFNGKWWWLYANQRRLARKYKRDLTPFELVGGRKRLNWHAKWWYDHDNGAGYGAIVHYDRFWVRPHTSKRYGYYSVRWQYKRGYFWPYTGWIKVINVHTIYGGGKKHRKRRR